MTWGRVADLLSSHFTVVCPDLPGIGRSFQPADAPDHRSSSKRQKAHACVEVMAHLGHETFAVIGHNRGSYVAFRMAMDRPDVVSRLVVIDGVPITRSLSAPTRNLRVSGGTGSFLPCLENPSAQS